MLRTILKRLNLVPEVLMRLAWGDDFYSDIYSACDVSHDGKSGSISDHPEAVGATATVFGTSDSDGDEARGPEIRVK